RRAWVDLGGIWARIGGTSGGRRPQRAHQVNCDDAVPHFRRVFEKGLDLIPASAVHQAVNPCRLPMRSSDKIINRRLVGEIERQIVDSEPLRGGLGGGGSSTRFIDVSDEHPPAFAGE